jgi:glycosyltransferase involved in cell wall biosynthesis
LFYQSKLINDKFTLSKLRIMLEFTYMQYKIIFTLFVLSLVIDLVAYISIRKKSELSKLLSVINVGLIFFVATSLLLFSFNLISVLFSVVSIFRAINISRLAVGKMNTKELTARYARSALWLSLYSFLVLVVDGRIDTITLLELGSVVSLLGATVLFATTVYSMLRWRIRRLDIEKLTSLPTVSICIPARNETQDLPECIESVLSSTYPKLEILVLDDCSHDKTPAIIKDYAHKGVRFIKGQEPNSNWVAKNSAMNKLFEESRGDIVVFTGVDVRFSPETIYHVVEQLEYGLLDMISVLPRREGASESSVFIQPLRYWWELSVPRLFGKRPPALSTLWAIRRKKLLSIGDFESVKRSVRPEAHFAKRLAKSYRFVLSGNRMGVTSIKGAKEQFDTALRMRYPQARRRPESVLALLLIQAIIFIMPIAVIVYGINNKLETLVTISAITITLLVAINIYISILSVKKSWLVGLISLPFLVIEEWYVLIRSMIAYEFGNVRWKERNICLPMLAVEKELPKL